MPGFDLKKPVSGVSMSPGPIPVTRTLCGASSIAATRVNISKVSGDGGLILFAGGMREHEHGHR